MIGLNRLHRQFILCAFQVGMSSFRKYPNFGRFGPPFFRVILRRAGFLTMVSHAFACEPLLDRLFLVQCCTCQTEWPTIMHRRSWRRRMLIRVMSDSKQVTFNLDAITYFYCLRVFPALSMAPFSMRLEIIAQDRG